jgi:hypothetical protein
MNKWLSRTQERWANVLPDDLVPAQSENEFVAQGTSVSDIARSFGLNRAQAYQLYKTALLAKTVPVLTYFKARDIFDLM